MFLGIVVALRMSEMKLETRIFEQFSILELSEHTKRKICSLLFCGLSRGEPFECKIRLHKGLRFAAAVNQIITVMYKITDIYSTVLIAYASLVTQQTQS